MYYHVLRWLLGIACPKTAPELSAAPCKRSRTSKEELKCYSRPSHYLDWKNLVWPINMVELGIKTRLFWQHGFNSATWVRYRRNLRNGTRRYPNSTYSGGNCDEKKSRSFARVETKFPLIRFALCVSHRVTPGPISQISAVLRGVKESDFKWWCNILCRQRVPPLGISFLHPPGTCRLSPRI